MTGEQRSFACKSHHVARRSAQEGRQDEARAGRMEKGARTVAFKVFSLTTKIYPLSTAFRPGLHSIAALLGDDGMRPPARKKTIRPWILAG